MSLISNLQRLIRIFRNEGVRALTAKIAWRIEAHRDRNRARQWIENHRLTEDIRNAMRSEIEGFPRQPLISVIIPVYNIDEKWLRRCIGSVRGQIYQNWELCIADDKSPDGRVREVLTELAEEDPRVRLVFRETNGHIAAASNSALDLATGEFAALLDHDDELSEDALFWVAKEIIEHPDVAFIYSDEDVIDEAGRRSKPTFKPDFSRDLFYSLNLITHLSAYRTEVLRAVGGFRIGSEGSQDYDLAMRVLEKVGESRIRHIPRILYHWRAIAGSVAFKPDEKPYAYERARESLRAHLARCGKQAEVSESVWNQNRVTYALPQPRPSILVIAFGAAETHDPEMVDHDRFLYSFCGIGAAELNHAAAESESDLICFIDSSLRPISAEWLDELARFAIQSEIGAVGAKIVDGSGITVSCGQILGGPELIRPAHGSAPRDAAGNMSRNRLISNFSAIGAECMMIRREIFENAGRFDSAAFPNALFDTDLCLRLRENGLRIVVTPFAELCGNPARREPTAKERREFADRWAEVIERDPYYNPNFTLIGRTFAIKVE